MSTKSLKSPFNGGSLGKVDILKTSKLTKEVLTSMALSFDSLYLIWGWTRRETR